MKSEDVDSPAYVPTIFEHTDVSLKRKAVQDMEIYNRAKKRRLEVLKSDQKLEADYGLLELSNDAFEMEAMHIDGQIDTQTPCYQSCSTMTDMSMVIMGDLETNCSQLRKEREDPLSKNNEKSHSAQSLQGDDKKVLFYTGLPSFKRLMAIFKFISPFIKDDFCSVSAFEQYVMVLTRLRLNMPIQHLSCI